MTDFSDDLTARTELDNCLVCSKGTRSHLVLIRYDEESGDMVAVDDRDDADGYGTVCHSCYRDHDGDADAVVASYNERLEAILDALGIDKQEVAERPDEVAGYRYGCTTCGDHMDATEVPGHQADHDEDVGFVRASEEHQA